MRMSLLETNEGQEKMEREREREKERESKRKEERKRENRVCMQRSQFFMADVMECREFGLRMNVIVC